MALLENSWVKVCMLRLCAGDSADLGIGSKEDFLEMVRFVSDDRIVIY